jgi:RHS repeat-associated protein
VSLAYTYGVLSGGTLDASKNNGNIESQTITIGATQIKQSYLYDQVNRLTSTEEKLNGASRWTQSYGFDRYGNRTSLTNSGPDAGLLPTQSTPAVDAATNRLIGFGYDTSGNVESDGVGNTFTYDAENRQTRHVRSGVSATDYSYDGNGWRVKKETTGTGAATTVLVYNAGGRLIAEYGTGSSQGGGTSYLTTDHLGSTRVVTGSDGTVRGRHDYMPFGEEIVGNVSGRQSIGGYGASDGIRQKFTQKERDTESGLDYFLARYYSSAQGRFTSVDPIAGSTLDPQTLNKYSYVADNPLTRRDPDGLYPRDQHQFITFLMAAILDIPDAVEIGRGAGYADSWRHATTGLGIPIPGLPFSIPPVGWAVNFSKHFGKIYAPDYYLRLKEREGPFRLGFTLHNVEDIAPGGPHHILRGSGLFSRILDSFAHVGLDIGRIFGLSKSPDRDPNRQGGWEAAWRILSYVYALDKEGEYPRNLIEAITSYPNRTGRTVTGVQYRSYSLGDVPDPKRHRLVDSFVEDGITVNVYEEIRDDKKKT